MELNSRAPPYFHRQERERRTEEKRLLDERAKSRMEWGLAAAAAGGCLSGQKLASSGTRAIRHGMVIWGARVCGGGG